MFRTSPVVAEDEWQLDLEVVDHIAVLTLRGELVSAIDTFHNRSATGPPSFQPACAG